jgi:L-ascorbate metabolism protein UlaG (beta-lactamase superfamily)
MHVEWHGQSAFSLTGADKKVFIDPFADMSAMAASRGMQFDYPATEVDGIDLLLVTHEHPDHNAVEVVAGEPTLLRSTAGRFESPVGEVVGIASEHDSAAGTENGPNTIFAFELDGLRVVHFGDFGQAELRPEQAAAIGTPDLLFMPVGDGPTIGGAAAAKIAAELGASWVVPMHYRTKRLSFLETEEEFVAAMPSVERPAEPSFETAELPRGDGPIAVVPASP